MKGVRAGVVGVMVKCWGIPISRAYSRAYKCFIVCDMYMVNRVFGDMAGFRACRAYLKLRFVKLYKTHVSRRPD